MIYIANSGGYNTFSLQKAIERVGGKSEVVSDPNTIYSASLVLIPGVGHAKHAIDKIKKLELAEAITKREKPTLGVCVGMQLLFSHSEEGDVDLLNILPDLVQHLPSNLKAPHMGWNDLNIEKSDSLNIEKSDSPILKNINSGDYAYFVHSYFIKPNEYTTSFCKYGDLNIMASMQYKNFFATQFHPEKSGVLGEKILKNFLEI